METQWWYVVERGDDVKQAEDILFTANMVFDKLSKLECNKSPGPDGIHPHLLKGCALSFAGPLAVIFQKSFDTGELPMCWKTANVWPFSKKDQGTLQVTTDLSVLHLCCVKLWN
jgi:hypothetical protein